MGEFNPQRQITRSTLRRSSLELALGRESRATCTPARGRSINTAAVRSGGRGEAERGSEILQGASLRFIVS